MNIRTKEGARRRFYAILNKCRRDSVGGLMFGLDWPTLRMTWPERYEELQRLKQLHKTLPERRAR